jgi:hypothetical protein
MLCEVCLGPAYINTAAQHGVCTREAQVAGRTHCLEIVTPRRWWFCVAWEKSASVSVRHWRRTVDATTLVALEIEQY